VGSSSTDLYAIDAGNGTELWKLDKGREETVFPSGVAIKEGAVYVGSGDGNLYSLNASTGEGIWSFDTGVSVPAMPAVSGGTVYFGAPDATFYAVDADDGSEAWKSEISEVKLTPAVAYGKVYIGTQSDFSCILYALFPHIPKFCLRFVTT